MLRLLPILLVLLAAPPAGAIDGDEGEVVRLDAALLSLASGMPEERIVPLSDPARGLKIREARRLWKEWRAGGEATPFLVDGLPRSDFGNWLRPPPDWPEDAYAVLRRLPYLNGAARKGVLANGRQWAPILLDRLDDPRHDTSQMLAELVRSGDADRAAVAARVAELRDAPHAWMRRRAAVVLHALDPPAGEAWLRRELEVYESWCHIGHINCAGQREGFPGRVDRALAGPEADPYDVVGEPVELPPETLEVVLSQIPGQEEPTWVLQLRNATDRVFERYPNFGHRKVVEPLPPGTGVGGGLTFCSHPRLVFRAKPGETTLSEKIRVPEERRADMSGVRLQWDLYLPGQRMAKYEVFLPAERFIVRPDLELFLGGIRSADLRDRRRVMGYAGGTDEERRVVRGELRALVDRLDGPDAPEAARFGFFPVGRVQWGWDQGELTRALDALKRDPDRFTAGDVDALLRLRAWGAIRRLRSVVPRPLLVDAVRRALGSADPLLVRNCALLFPLERPAGEEEKAAVARWLASEDPLVFRAGLYGAVVLGLPPDPPVWERALASEDEVVARAGIHASEDLLAEPHPLLFTRFWEENSVEIRNLILGVLEHDPGGPAARSFLRTTIPAYPELSEKVRRTLRRLYGRLEPSDVPALLALRRRTGDDRIVRPLVALGYRADSPVIRRFATLDRGVELLERHESAVREQEALRLDLPEPPPADRYYRDRLRESLRIGDEAQAILACLPLLGESAPETLAIFEMACRADRRPVRRIAALGLYLGDRKLGLPRLREELPDLRHPDRESREFRGLLDALVPELSPPK